jgi:hypothetical protein
VSGIRYHGGVDDGSEEYVAWRGAGCNIDGERLMDAFTCSESKNVTDAQ